MSSAPGVDLEDHRRSLLDRFANVHVRDTLQRLATDGSDRIAYRLLRDRGAQAALGELTGAPDSRSTA